MNKKRKNFSSGLQPPFSASDLSRLQRAWAVQLSKEHEWIAWQHRVTLTRPVIEIINLAGSWGSWNKDYGTIRLSTTLISEYPWEVVLGVLKHEMAHQLATEQLDGDHRHGPSFERACRMLGVPEKFRGAQGDLPRTLTDPKAPDLRDDVRRLMDKVQKLLALAQSSNENEAAIAMAKANEIIARYNLDKLERSDSQRYTHLIINTNTKRLENYQRHLTAILVDYYFVDVVLSHQYDAKRTDKYRTIELFGASENVLMAEYVYNFLLNQLEILWRSRQMTDYSATGRDKRSYWLGVLRGFHEKLKRQESSRTASGMAAAADSSKTTSALVLAKDSGLHEFIRLRYPRLTRYASRGSKVNIQAYHAGMEDGRELILHRGVTNDTGITGLMITKE
ncbi:MAG: DUF2786 domain-containing protein [Deltaproteobacteria bacterium]|nr:DUF2786 domain-containing protein [Deltaproteobacteria bacterium]